MVNNFEEIKEIAELGSSVISTYLDKYPELNSIKMDFENIINICKKATDD